MAAGGGPDSATLPGMTTLKVSSPAELISAVPFLIGFHPADSLTVVAMHGPRITFAVRVDLPEHSTPDEEARAAVLHLATVVLQQQAEAVSIIGYGDEPRVTPAVLRISDAFRKAGLTIVDELRVAQGRFWSYLCTDQSCCPAEGRPCEPPDSVVAAEATFAGAVALPSREALAEQLTPVTGDDREAVAAATARALLRLAALAGEHPPNSDLEVSGSGRPGPAELRLGGVLWASLGIAAPLPEDSPDRAPDEDHFFARVRREGRLAVREAERRYRSGGRLTDDEAAWLGVLLLHVPVRDYAWTRTRTSDWELALWSDLVRRVEARFLPAPAGLLAFVSWRTGQGPLASVAVERALAEKDDYPLAVLMQSALTTGLPPSSLDGWPAVEGLPALIEEHERKPEGAPASDQQTAVRSVAASLRPGKPATAPRDRADSPPDQPERRRRTSRRAGRRRI